MDPEAEAIITPHLLAGERLLWCGRPRDTRALRGRAAAIVLVGIAALAMRWWPFESSLAQRAGANSFLLATVVLVLIAEAIVFHTYLSNTFYGVTNQRVVIVSGLGQLSVREAFLDKLNTPWLRLRRFGNTLELRQSDDVTHRLFQNPSVLPRGAGYRLVGLETAGEVYRTILDATDKLK